MLALAGRAAHLEPFDVVERNHVSNTQPTVQRLGEVLVRCDRELWDLALYLPQGRQWNLETPCLLWDPDDVASDEEETPAVARSQGFSYALGMQDVIGIVENARAQVGVPTPAQLLEALFFYYDHDAFIDFENPSASGA